MASFHKYYSGAARAYVPTLFIGGNHEASSYMLELFHGGWVAPNIYFLGQAGSVRFGGLRITGASGIYKKHDYRKGLHEQPPFSRDSVRSVYHIREFQVFQLLQLQQSSTSSMYVPGSNVKLLGLLLKAHQDD